MDANKITNVSFDGIDHSDYPDYCDAYVTQANYEGEPMTEAQLEDLNDDRDLVHQLLFNHLH